MVRDRLARASGDEWLTTPAGGMRLADYLPARTFELTVHSVDLVRNPRHDDRRIDRPRALPEKFSLLAEGAGRP